MQKGRFEKGNFYSIDFLYKGIAGQVALRNAATGNAFTSPKLRPEAYPAKQFPLSFPFSANGIPRQVGPRPRGTPFVGHGVAFAFAGRSCTCSTHAHTHKAYTRACSNRVYPCINVLSCCQSAFLLLQARFGSHVLFSFARACDISVVQTRKCIKGGSCVFLI